MFCECTDIRHSYGRRVVLDVAYLAIPAGRITSVIGPNGAGKTTLLEILSLLKRPQSGELRLWGKPAAQPDLGLRRSVVMVMQPGFLFRGTVRSNVLYGLRARGVSRKAAGGLAEESLEMVGLSKFADSDVAELSAGERQRVNIARAIALRPRALLLDEPTANTDTECDAVIGRAMRWLQEQAGTTVVHASPSQNGLMSITENVIELDAGRIVGQRRCAPEGGTSSGQCAGDD